MIEFAAQAPGRKVFALFGVVCLWFATGCTTANVQVYHQLEKIDRFPQTVAVLPFTVNEDISEGERPHYLFREVFYDYFSYLGYTDVPLEEIDGKLGKIPLVLPEAPPPPNPARLRDVLGVDAVVWGHIVKASNFTGLVHAQTSITAKLGMTDLRTGEMLWEVEHTEFTYSGIATPSVVDLIQEQMENVKLRKAYYKVAERFTLQVLAGVPDPGEMRKANVRLPRIDSIEVNVQPDQILNPDDRIYVSISGQPGLTACFDIGNWKTGITMKEITPGLYTGSYQIGPGDRFKNVLIIGTLKNKRGLAGKKIYKEAMVSTQDS